MSLQINLHGVARTARSAMSTKICHLMTKGVLGTLLSLALLAPMSQAQFKVTDNFNRADGAPGLGWSAWGNGAQISGNQVETFGEFDVAGGISRTLDVTFPLSFAFDFNTTTPSDGGWSIAFNAADTTWDANVQTSEVRLLQYSGSQGLCMEWQTSEVPIIKCGSPRNGQRDYTATAHITGTINPDFSATVTMKYNDGLTPAAVTLKMAAPVGAIQNPLGSLLVFGNANESYGPHYFDNFSLTLN